MKTINITDSISVNVSLDTYRKIMRQHKIAVQNASRDLDFYHDDIDFSIYIHDQARAWLALPKTEQLSLCACAVLWDFIKEE